jgi:hypothetical protein
LPRIGKDCVAALVEVGGMSDQWRRLHRDSTTPQHTQTKQPGRAQPHAIVPRGEFRRARQCELPSSFSRISDTFGQPTLIQTQGEGVALRRGEVCEPVVQLKHERSSCKCA